MTRRAETRARERFRRGARRVLSHPLFLLAILIGAFAITTTWTRVTASSDFCATCHETDRVVETAAASVHADLACIDCHGGGTGIRGAFGYVPTLVREAVQQTTGWGVAEGVMGARACTSCHRSSKILTAAGGESAADGKGVSHPDPKSNCASCHGEVAHPGLKKAKTEEATSGEDHPKNWVQLHGREALSQGQEQCAACHRPVFCSTCHFQAPVSHPDGWIRTHGQSVGAAEGRGCDLCHQQVTFCKGCHGVEVPHDADWFQEHPRAAYELESQCYTCHAQPGCASCHERHSEHGEYPEKPTASTQPPGQTDSYQPPPNPTFEEEFEESAEVMSEGTA